MSSVYIHIPFCIKKCSYCDFYSVPYTKPLAERYISSMIEEIRLFAGNRGKRFGENILTLYIGGGTPSLLPADLLLHFISELGNFIDLASLREFTIEANPGTVTEEKVAAYGDGGVTRISLGVQSFNERHLKKLGRIHDGDAAVRALETLAAGGFKVNVDLIFGIPGQEKNDTANDLDRVTGLQAGHVSLYALSIEEGTPLYREVISGLVMPGEEQLAITYGESKSILEKRGFIHYEISNFARNGEQSLHNLGYWRGSQYVAFGASASGYVKEGVPPWGMRYRNIADLGSYISTVEKGRLPREECDVLDQDRAWKERLIMGLRLIEGIDIGDISEELGRPPPGVKNSLESLIGKGLLIEEEGRVKVPERFIFTSSEILQQLV